MDWNTLRKEHGTAGTISVLLRTMSPDVADEVVPLLFGELCDQGSVSTGSFDALPELADAAARWNPRQRIPLLALAAAILSPSDCGDDDAQGLVQGFIRNHTPVLARLRELCMESMSLPDLSKEELVDLLASARSFEGDSLWAQRLEQLACGEFQGPCPHCGVHLYLVVGEDGRFVTAEEWFKSDADSVSLLQRVRNVFRSLLRGSSNQSLSEKKPEGSTVRVGIKRNPIRPAVGEMPAPGQWLYDRCVAAKKNELAECIPFIFGTSNCPKCGQAFSLEQAIAEA